MQASLLIDDTSASSTLPQMRHYRLPGRRQCGFAKSAASADDLRQLVIESDRIKYRNALPLERTGGDTAASTKIFSDN